MKKTWFAEFLRVAAPLPWTSSEADEIVDALVGIAIMNQGDVYDDVAIPDAWKRDHALDAVTGALDGLARAYAHALGGGVVRDSAVIDTSDFAVELPNVRPCTLVPKLDVNLASEDELTPILGRAIAASVVESRHTEGAFRSISELVRVKGLGEKGIPHAAASLFVRRGKRSTNVASGETAAFLEKPSFASYVRLVSNGGPRVSRFGDDGTSDLKTHLRREIRGLRDDQEQAADHPYRSVPGTLASQVRSRREAHDRAAAIEGRAVEGKTHGVLLEDSRYPYFVRDLLQQAQSRIRIIMFFMRFEDKKKYPTDELFDALVKARGRGVDIKVILDRDAEGAAIGSREINKQAFEFFKKHRIPVTYDSVERYTHTKLVTVDEKHVVIGSHNWTAGSFFAYDDASVYLRSPELAQRLDGEFDTLWRDYRA